MTDRILTVIAEQLGGPKYAYLAMDDARRILAALKAARIAVVELPEPTRKAMVTDYPHGVYALPGHVGVYVGEWLFRDLRSCERSPQEIGEFAASLLAAKAAAEASQ